MSGGKLSICARISGETFSRNQEAPSALTATDSWVGPHGPARAAPHGSCRSRSSIAAHRHRPRNRGRGLARTRRAGPLADGSVAAIGAGRLGCRGLGSDRTQGSRSVKSLPYPPISALMSISTKAGVSQLMAVFCADSRSESRPTHGVARRSPAPAGKQSRRPVSCCIHAACRTPCASWLLAAVLRRAPGGTPAPRPSRRDEAYVSGEESGEIIVVDVDKGAVAARIPVGKRPRGIKLSRDGKLLYVALSGSPRGGPGVDESKLPPGDRTADGVGVVDLASHKLLRTLESGQDPESFDLSRDGKTLYVSNEETAEMSVLDLASGKVKHKVAVGHEPEGVTLRPDGKAVYVTSETDNEITAVDTRKLKVLGQSPPARARAGSSSPPTARRRSPAARTAAR